MPKKILILGGFGFIGTNLTEELLKRDKYSIIIFEANKVFIQNPDLLSRVEVYNGDFNNEKDYEIIFKEHKIDMVIHLIGTTIPLFSNTSVIYDINSNLVNTIKLLNIMRKYQVKNIVFPSSGGTVYGILNKEHEETDATTPICSYGIMKLTIEKYIYLYNYLYGINYLILRLSNPFGEYHLNKNQGFINVVLEKILNGEIVEIWGDGSVVRDFIYIKDLVKIIIDLIDMNIKNEIINIGSGQGYSINEILTIIKREIGAFSLKYVEGRKVDVPYLILNIDKLKSFLSINLMGIEEAIKKTYYWLEEKVS